MSATTVTSKSSIRKQRRAEWRIASAAKRVVANEGKRAAVVLRRGMRQSEFRVLGAEFGARALTIAPILAGPNGDKEARRNELCGLVVTGADGLPSPSEIQTIERAVRDMIARKLPVLALTEAVEPVLRAAGHEAPEEDAYGALIARGRVRLLASRKDVSEAIDVIAKTEVRAVH